MAARLRDALPALIGLALFLAALTVLRSQLDAVTWQGLTTDVLTMPRGRLAAAVILTAVNYAVLTGYDFLAFAYLGRRLPWRRIAVTSFLAYAIANNVGFAMLSGTSVRYRFYTRWGITAQELSRLVFSCVATFWLGLLLVGGLSLALAPLPREVGQVVAAVARPAGWLLARASLTYVAAAAFGLGPVRVRHIELPLPRAPVALAQLLVSIVDWTVAATVLFVLLPPGSVPFVALLGAFVASQLLGLTSHVPGGVGVFEGMMVLLLSPLVPSATLVPALVVYRAVYYLLPLTIATVALVADEVRQRRSQAARMAAALGSSGTPDRRSIGGRLSSRRDSRRGGSRRCWRRLAPRSGSGCSRSSTWSTRTNCGGGSSCMATPRECCEPRSAPASRCCCLRRAV